MERFCFEGRSTLDYSIKTRGATRMYIYGSKDQKSFREKVDKKSYQTMSMQKRFERADTEVVLRLTTTLEPARGRFRPDVCARRNRELQLLVMPSVKISFLVMPSFRKGATGRLRSRRYDRPVMGVRRRQFECEERTCCTASSRRCIPCSSG